MSEIIVGDIKVMTTDNRGHNPEEMADLAVEKIIYVGKDSHPAIIEQARAFKAHIHAVLVDYFHRAQEQERVTITAKLHQHGYNDIANILGSI